jgi:hypothetical protein
MGQSSGAVKVVKGSRAVKSTFPTICRRKLHLVEHVALNLEARSHFEESEAV